jgi:alcohol dehydrogenase
VIAHRAPATVRLGGGAVARAGDAVRELGGRRALLVTSLGMPQRPGFQRLLDSLAGGGATVEVWAETPAEPEASDLAAAVAHASGFRPDVVVGLGGGSALDLAKLTAILLAHGGPVDRYYGTGRLPGRGRPTLLLPTTAGSGSEVSHDAVLTDRAAGTKRAVKDPHLVPSCALVDPELTWTCPPPLTAASGLDAFCHAIEAFTNPRADALTDFYALESMRLIRDHLPRAFAAGDDAPARAAMARGALLAGLAFAAVGTAAIHACGYPLSGLWGLPHGVANALMLPEVVAFNAASCGKYRPVASLFGGEDLPGALRGLLRSVGLPTRLRALGVSCDSIPRLAEIASRDERHLSANPRPVSRGDLEGIFERSW